MIYSTVCFGWVFVPSLNKKAWLGVLLKSDKTDKTSNCTSTQDTLVCFVRKRSHWKKNCNCLTMLRIIIIYCNHKLWWKWTCICKEQTHQQHTWGTLKFHNQIHHELELSDPVLPVQPSGLFHAATQHLPCSSYFHQGGALEWKRFNTAAVGLSSGRPPSWTGRDFDLQLRVHCAELLAVVVWCWLI